MVASPSIFAQKSTYPVYTLRSSDYLELTYSSSLFIYWITNGANCGTSHEKISKDDNSFIWLSLWLPFFFSTTPLSTSRCLGDDVSEENGRTLLNTNGDSIRNAKVLLTIGSGAMH